VSQNQELIRVAVTAIRMYAESHPRPSHVNITQAANMLDLSRKTVGGMVRNGTFTLNACGLIPIHQIDEAIAAQKAA
jgi:hypothetical protein